MVAVGRAIKIRNFQLNAEPAEELENRCTGNRTGGSNPSPSARKVTRLIFFVKSCRGLLSPRARSQKSSILQFRECPLNRRTQVGGTFADRKSTRLNSSHIP